MWWYFVNGVRKNIIKYPYDLISDFASSSLINETHILLLLDVLAIICEIFALLCISFT